MTRSARACLAMLLVTAVALPAAAQNVPRGPRGRAERLDDARNGPEVVEQFSRTVRMGRTGTLDVSNVAGTIAITGGGGNDVVINAVKRTRNPSEEEGRARLREIEIQVSEVNGRVEVRTVYPRQQRRLVGVVDYTIALPQDASVSANSVSGNIRVMNVRGELRLGTVSGDVDASGGRRLAALRSVSGNITVADSDADDLLTIRSVSGSQTLRGLRARNVDTSSVSGDLRFDGANVERLDAKTVSGDVDLDGQLPRNARYQVATHSGRIRLAVSDVGFAVDANTFSGDFRSDYALTLRGDSDDAGAGRRRRLNRRIRGTYGDGSAILDLQSFSGGIAILKR